MEYSIVACETLRDEVEAILRQEQLDIPVVWFPSGLHNVPGELSRRIQQELDKLPPTDHVLMAMAYCGNAVAGIRSRDFSLTIPRMDDCISLLLGKVKATDPNCTGIYFMTAGWLRGERSLLAEYQYVIGKYGKSRGEKVFQVMFQHYTHIAMLDSGCFDKDTVEAEMRETARILKLGYQQIPADLSLLRQLLCGPWPEHSFLTIPPHTELTPNMLTLPIQKE